MDFGGKTKRFQRLDADGQKPVKFVERPVDPDEQDSSNRAHSHRIDRGRERPNDDLS